jgi:carbonic anhydrase
MYSLVVAASLASMASAMCNYGTSLNPRSEKRAEASFGYHELDGALNWHGLNELSAPCATGQNQSPINVIPSELTTVCGSSLQFDVEDAPEGLEFENLGTTVEVFAEGGSIVLGDATYNLAQFHFHTPSEHHINGEYFPAEVHFVFQTTGTCFSKLMMPSISPRWAAANTSLLIDNKTAVVGFPIEITGGLDTSPLLSSVLAFIGNIPNAGDITRTTALDFADLERTLSTADVYQYSGSLTTPPCSEEISWNVVATPLTIDLQTFKTVKSILKFNSRYTQNTPGEVNLLDNARNVLDG